MTISTISHAKYNAYGSVAYYYGKAYFGLAEMQS